MKKLMRYLPIVLISLLFMTTVKAQEYNELTDAESKAGITFVESDEKESSEVPGSSDNTKKNDNGKNLPKTNELMNPKLTILGSLLLIVCYFIFRKKIIKGEV